MHNYKLTYKPFGERAILIEWPQEINEAILYDVLAFKKVLKSEAYQDIIQAYCSLTIVYKHPIKEFLKEVEGLKNTYKNRSTFINSDSKTWRIPVCYDSEFGIDLEEISKQTKLSKSEIVQLHTSPDYLVYFLGFLPGFLYLGGLEEKINMPRKAIPRILVPKGSVAIGGSQTGVYPQESAGGWNIIGQSPVNFFNPKSNTPCFVKAGDKVRFYSVDQTEFQLIKEEVLNGNYKPEYIE